MYTTFCPGIIHSSRKNLKKPAIANFFERKLTVGSKFGKDSWNGNGN